MQTERKVRYCALTTIPVSMRQFLLPSLENLSVHGFEVTAACKKDEEFGASLPKEIKYLPLNIDRGYSVRKTFSTICTLYKYFKKDKTDMVEYGTENVAFCASVAAWMARVPVRIYNHWGARYVGFTGFSRIISLIIEKTAAFFSTDIRQQSVKNMQMCIDDHIYPAGKVKVLGYGGTVGADFSRFDISKKQEFRTAMRQKYGIPESAIVYGDIGSIRRDKGTNELISAFRKLDKKDAWLVLVGDIFEPDAPDRELMEWAGNCPNVIFTGHVGDVEHYVTGFDCIVHPSYREGLGMVLQEAGAVGVPYIVADIPGPSEFGIEGETGLIAVKADAEDLFRKMKILYEDRELLRHMSKQVFRLTKERYERGIMLQRLLDDRIELLKEVK